MEKVKLLVAWIVFAGVATYGQDREIEFTEYDLDNGLHVILHEDHSVPLVAIGVMYHVGSKDEDPQRTGFAHFFEHLMFEGSENIDRGEFFALVNKRGGRLNAYTSFDLTYYFELLPANELKLGLWLESERMLHAKVDKKGIETQRKVVKEEKRQRYDNRPYGSFNAEVFDRAFPGHPYRWTPIGSMEHLDAANFRDYESFYEQFYVPNNATLVIAGDIDPGSTLEMVKQFFSEIPRGKEKIHKHISKPTPPDGPIHDTIYDNIQLPALYDCYRMPARNSPDFHAMDLLRILLGGGKSSRLESTLVDEEQLTRNVTVYHRTLEEAGLFIIDTKPNAGVSLEILEQQLTAELAKVRSAKIGERELQKLQNKARSDFIEDNSDLQGIAHTLASFDLLLGDAELINTEMERYMKVTAEDIRRVANTYLTPANNIRLYYLPKEDE